jgi:hypothetical protein
MNKKNIEIIFGQVISTLTTTIERNRKQLQPNCGGSLKEQQNNERKKSQLFVLLVFFFNAA